MTQEDKEFDQLMISEDKIFDLEEAKKEYKYHYKRIKEILEIYPQLINTK